MRISSLLHLAVLATSAVAQVLVNGNSNLPTCAKGCGLLNQAAQACSGTTTANQQTWQCFCLSGYLTNLYTSPVGICDTVCTNPNDNQQVMTWYKSNCGTDHGASEHPGAGNGGTTPTTAGTGPASTSGSSSNPADTSSSNSGDSGSTKKTKGGWFSTHWQWVVMVIILFFGLLGLALLGVWLKRRHDRKRDQIPNAFNAGIKSRPAPVPIPIETTHVNNSQVRVGPGMESGSGRNSPARTREAFMPYGYGYTRSESRLASQERGLDRISPAPRSGTPVSEMEKGGMDAGQGASVAKQQKRSLARERDPRGFGEGEKF